jgi:hypothetical protein
LIILLKNNFAIKGKRPSRVSKIIISIFRPVLDESISSKEFPILTIMIVAGNIPIWLIK